MSIQDGTASVKSTLSKDKASRTTRTKLEKIMELKTENTKMKRENKSLKKTMKKLLGQLSRESERKEELQHLLDEGGMGMLDGSSSVRSSGALLDASSIKSSRSKQGPTTADNTEKEEDAKKSSEPQQQQQQDAETMATNTTNDESLRSGSSQPPYDVVIHHSDEEESESNKKKQRRKTSINDDTDSSTKVTTTTNKDDSDTRRTAKSPKTLNKNIAYLKRKLKREREAHQSTEFRLKVSRLFVRFMVPLLSIYIRNAKLNLHHMHTHPPIHNTG